MTAPNPLRERGGVVDALSSALDRGGHGLSNAPALLKRLLETGGWREFETLRGEIVRYENFLDFLATPPTAGLGVGLDLVRRVIATDVEAVDLLDRVVRVAPGGDRGKMDNIQSAAPPNGTSQAAALRRLRKDAPELHAAVLAGNLSAHAAMVQAGFRRRVVSVPVDQPDAVARALRKNLSPEDLAKVVALLGQETAD